RGVANDDGQHVDPEVVERRAPDGAADEEAPVAAADIDDEGRGSAKEGGQVERPLGGELFERRLRPEGWIEYLAGDRHAERALDDGPPEPAIVPFVGGDCAPGAFAKVEGPAVVRDGPAEGLGGEELVVFFVPVGQGGEGDGIVGGLVEGEVKGVEVAVLRHD